jgi:hypothetical protein
VFVLDAAGLQAFVLVGSSRSLPPFAQWRRGAGPIPWKAAKEDRTGCWYFDGQELNRYPQDRGTLLPREDVPRMLRDLCGFFKGRAEFEVISVIGFPVMNNRK